MKSNESAASGRASGEAIDAFARLAECYCDSIDARGEVTEDGLLHKVHSLLPLLYSAALALPDPDADEAGEEEATDDPVDAGDEEHLLENMCRSDPDRITHEQWQLVFDSLRKLLDRRDGYWMVFDPYANPSEPPVFASLADDFADIYRDLLYGLIKYRRGMPEEAAWAWRFHFNGHWAAHASSALRTIEALASMHGLGFTARDTLRGP